MPGFKTFAAGSVLASADVNGFLMQQAVIQCTSTTRPSSPNTGMTVFETDTGIHRFYNGTAWVPVVNARLTGAVGAAVGTAPTLPGGLFTMQAGSSVQNYATGGVTINFPVTFPNGVLTIVLTDGDDTTAHTLTLVNPSTTTAGFKVQQWAASGAEVGAGGGFRVNWIAIGF